MHGPNAGVRDGSQELTSLQEQRPELSAWLRPLSAALAFLRVEPWRSLAPLPAPVRDPAAPLLHQAILPLDPAAARELVSAVLGEAIPLSTRSDAIGTLDPLALLDAAIAQDHEALERAGAAAGVEAGALAAAAQLAALPLLQRCGRALEHLVAESWQEGYCPVCGAWPSLVEVRGLERARTLRCGRCGCAWTTQVLLCPFCGERDHPRLGSLVPDGVAGQTAWLETCASCGSYLKAVATLRGTAPEALLIRDAATIELDLAAAERGFSRPSHPGFGVSCHLAATA